MRLKELWIGNEEFSSVQVDLLKNRRSDYDWRRRRRSDRLRVLGRDVAERASSKKKSKMLSTREERRREDLQEFTTFTASSGSSVPVFSA